MDDDVCPISTPYPNYHTLITQRLIPSSISTDSIPCVEGNDDVDDDVRVEPTRKVAYWHSSCYDDKSCVFDRYSNRL